MNQTIYMARVLTTLSLIFILISGASAQQGSKTFTRKDTVWTISYFATGQKSTVIYSLVSDSRWHQLKAYDKSGKVIYERSYGLKHGSSGVDLKYHPNGGIYTAHYTMQPDGGIQHYDVSSYFTPEGKLDHEEDNSLGDDGLRHLQPIYSPLRTPAPNVQIAPHPLQKPNECIPMPASTEIFLINYTSERLHVRSQYTAIQAGPVYYDVDPSDTVKIGAYFATAGNPGDPLGQYSLRVETKPRNGFEYRITNAAGGTTLKQYVMAICRRIRK
jgi:hypothetical protein